MKRRRGVRRSREKESLRVREEERTDCVMEFVRTVMMAREGSAKAYAG